MLISVVIPAYNRAEYIERTLKSVKEQTYRPIELIIVDNNSTDSTKLICKRFLKAEETEGFKIKLLEEKTPGASAARNCGLKEALGKWVCFFDSDDIMSPMALQDSVDAIKENPDADVVAYATCLVKDNGDSAKSEGIPVKSKVKRRVFLYTSDIKAHILMGELSTQSFIAKADFIRKIGGWNEHLVRWNDWELGVRILLAKPLMVWLRNRAYHYIFEHEDSITGKSFSDSLPHLQKAIETVKTDLDAVDSNDNSALLALYFRENILKGIVKRECAKGCTFSRMPQIRCKGFVNRIFAKVLYFYTSCGGKGAWKIALTYLDICKNKG